MKKLGSDNNKGVNNRLPVACEDSHTGPYSEKLAGGNALIVEVDYDRYAHFLAEMDWTETEKREFLQVLQNILIEFIWLGFSVHPVQRAEPGCGKFEDNTSSAAFIESDKLYLDQALIGKFEIASGMETDREEKESVHE